MVDGQGDYSEARREPVSDKAFSGLKGIALGTRILEDDRGIDHPFEKRRETGELDEHARYALDLAEKTVVAQGTSMARVTVGAYLAMLVVLVVFVMTGLLWVPYLFWSIIVVTVIGVIAVGVRVYRRRWARGAPK